MDWYSIGQWTVSVIGGVIANLLSTPILNRLLKRIGHGDLDGFFIIRRPNGRIPGSKARGIVSITLNPTLFSVAVLVGCLVVISIVVQFYPAISGDHVTLVQPVQSALVPSTFWAKGTAKGAPPGTYVYLVTRDLDTQGAPYVVTDVWPVGKNGWWQGIGRVPPGTPVLARILVYAVSSTTTQFEVGQKLQFPPNSTRKGGGSNNVTITFSGP